MGLLRTARRKWALQLACGAVALAVATVSGCSGASPVGPTPSAAVPVASAPDATFLSIESGPGDPVGRAFSWRFTLENAVFRAFVDATQNHVRVSALSTQDVESWTLNVAAPAGQPLVAGKTYNGAVLHTVAGSQTRSVPGLSFSSMRSCLQITGHFVIRELVVGPGNTLDRFHATFEQFCNGASSSLKGEFMTVANPWR